MFSGWSFAPTAPSGGGGWSTGTVVPITTSSGGGWSTGTGTISSAPSGSSWSTGAIAPISSPISGGGYIYSAPVYTSYNYQGSAYPNALPGAGLYAMIRGEQGPYTPLDYPLMHELAPGERLEDLGTRLGLSRGSVLPYLALGVIAALLLKR